MSDTRPKGLARRVAYSSIPAIGFLVTPFLPFSLTPTLWFGVPAVLVWTALMVLLTVALLQVADLDYRRNGGDDFDRLEEAEEEGVSK